MERKLWLLVIVLALIGPLKMALLYSFPPEGFVFNGFGTDEAIFFTTMMAPEFGFESPWVLDTDPIGSSILSNPASGPVFILVPLGILSFAAAPIFLFNLFELLSAIFFMLVCYYLLKEFTSDNKAFILLIITAGFGGLLHILFRLATDPSQMFVPFTLFGFGIGTYRIIEFYYSFPFALSLLSFLFYMKSRYAVAGLLLGVTALLYPLYAFVILLTIVLYSFVMYGLDDIKNIAKVVAISAPFGAAWLMSTGSYFFTIYSDVNKYLGVAFLPSILLSLGVPVLLLMYELWKKTGGIRWHYIALWLVAIAMISASQFAQTFWSGGIGLGPVAAIVSIASNFYPLFEVLFFIMLAKFSYDIYRMRDRLERKYFFVAAWLALMIFLSMAPIMYIPWIPLKIVSFIIFPVSILAAEGISRVSERYNVSAKTVLVAVAVIAIPSIFLFHVFDVMRATGNIDPWLPQNFYYSESDYNALLFLKSQPQGVVLASAEIGTYLPYYTGKKTLLFGLNRTDMVYNFSEKYEDYVRFYSVANADGGRSIIKKYNISYVFFGRFEKNVSNIISLDNVAFLQKIYSNDTEIYAVRALQ